MITIPAQVVRTEAAAALMARLAAKHGPLMFHQSGGCCDGSSPMCYARGEFLTGDSSIFEFDALPKLAADGKLSAFRHDGYWQCMDNLREVELLNKLWDGGHAPWKIW